MCTYVDVDSVQMQSSIHITWQPASISIPLPRAYHSPLTLPPSQDILRTLFALPLTRDFVTSQSHTPLQSLPLYIQIDPPSTFQATLRQLVHIHFFTNRVTHVGVYTGRERGTNSAILFSFPSELEHSTGRGFLPFSEINSPKYSQSPLEQYIQSSFSVPQTYAVFD